MFTDQSTDITLAGSCCTIDSIRGEKHSNYWIAGITNVSGGIGSSSNSSTLSSLQILQFHSDSNEITVNATYEIDDIDTPIRKLLSCPHDKELVLVSNEQRSVVSLYRLPSSTFTATPSLSKRNYDDDDDDYDTHQHQYTKRNDQRGHDNIYDDDATTKLDDIQLVASLNPEGGYGANIIDVAWRNDAAGTSATYDHEGYNDDVTNHDSNDNSTHINNTVSNAITLDMNGHLTLWDMNLQQQTQSFDTITTQSNNSSIPQSKVIWDPHSNGNTIAVTVPSKKFKYVNMIALYDLRCDNSGTGSNGSVSVMDNIVGNGIYQQHYGITDMDFNPNRPHMIGTACRDGTMKFYDIRHNTSTTTNSNCNKYPIVTARGGHSHYCTSIQYNPYHDQLVLSTGTDHVCNLWRISSCSSSPLLLNQGTDSSNHNDIMNSTSPTYIEANNEYNNETASPSASPNLNSTSVGANGATNICVQQYSTDMYNSNDTTYTTSWGANDAWIYMVVVSSYNSDGKAILHHVPSHEKYKILL